MKNALIIGGLCIVLLALGAAFYFHASSPAEGTPATASTEAPAKAEVKFKVLGVGEHAETIVERKNYAIYDLAQYNEMWKRAHNDDGTKAPYVDFNTSYVIGVFAGRQPTAGYSIAVTRVTETGDARTVAVTIEEPGDGCNVIEEETSPYQFVVVPFSESMALAHTDVRSKKDCR